MKKIFSFLLTVLIVISVFSPNVFAQDIWNDLPTVELNTQIKGTFNHNDFDGLYTYTAQHEYKFNIPGPGKIHVTLNHDSKYVNSYGNSVILQITDLRKYLFRDAYEGNTITSPDIDVQEGMYRIVVVGSIEDINKFDQPINYDFTIYYTPDGNPPVQGPEGSIYRLYNQTTGEHLYTPDYNEATVLVLSHGWTNENIGWTAPLNGEAVFRLYNPGSGDHLYTTDTNEVSVLTSQQGWQADNNMQPLFYSGGEVPIYRLFNSLTGRHHLTKDGNEYQILGTQNWQQEGQKLSCLL